MQPSVLAKQWVGALCAREQQYDKWCYERGILVKAMLDAYDALGSERARDFALTDAEARVTPQGDIIGYPKDTYNLDMLCYGRVLPALYALSGDARYEKAARLLLTQLDGQPRTPQGGFWHKQIYPQQMWLDGIYMGCGFLAPVAQWLGMDGLFDEIAKQMLLIGQKTFDEKSGLFFHAWDASCAQRWANKETGCSPHIWGRAMGWFAMAHADVLAVFPASHKAYPALKAQFQTLCRGVLRARHEGLWAQVTDRPTQEGNYLESSCSAMFIYAFAKGERLGLLEAPYRQAALDSLCALYDRSVTYDADGLPVLHSICKVAGLGGEPYRDGSYSYYIHETVCDGDYKGTAPLLMACAELARE